MGNSEITISGIHLYTEMQDGEPEHVCVAIEVNNEWVEVIRSSGPIISHICETAGALRRVRERLEGKADG